MEPESFDGVWRQSPDGTMLARVHKRTIFVCDASRVLLALKGCDSAHWSPDSTKLAAVSDDGIRVWHVRDARLLCSVDKQFVYFYYYVSWSPDSTRIEYSYIPPLVWAPNGSRSAAAKSYLQARCTKSVIVQDAGRTSFAIEGCCLAPERCAFKPIAWSPNGALLAVSSCASTPIYDIVTLRPVLKLPFCASERGQWINDGSLLVFWHCDQTYVYNVSREYRYSVRTASALCCSTAQTLCLAPRSSVRHTS